MPQGGAAVKSTHLQPVLEQPHDLVAPDGRLDAETRPTRSNAGKSAGWRVGAHRKKWVRLRGHSSFGCCLRPAADSSRLACIASAEFRVERPSGATRSCGLLEDGLQECVDFTAAPPVGHPFPGDSEQTVYVWFDALINYLSATGFPDPGYERLWPADLHVVGKGITRFHCVIWPAMLLAADLALPRQVWAHGYVQWEGTKMSKTAGTAVSLAPRSSATGPTHCATSCCARSATRTTATSPGTGSTRAMRPISPIRSAISHRVHCPMVHRYRGGVVPQGSPDSALERAGADDDRRLQPGDGCVRAATRALRW